MNVAAYVRFHCLDVEIKVTVLASFGSRLVVIQLLECINKIINSVP